MVYAQLLALLVGKRRAGWQLATHVPDRFTTEGEGGHNVGNIGKMSVGVFLAS